MKLSSRSSALVSPRVLLGAGLVTVLSLFGGTGCTSRSLTGLYIEPTTGLTCVVPSVAAQFKAYGTYTEGGHATQTEDLTDSVTWYTTIPAVAAVNSSGMVTGVGVGTTPVLANTQGEFGTLKAESNIVVADPTVGCTSSSGVVKPFSLSIIPGNQILTAGGQTVRLLAIATYNNGENAGSRTTDISRQVSWESSNIQVATVDATGLVTAVGPGDATITASSKAADGTVVTATQSVHFEGAQGAQ